MIMQFLLYWNGLWALASVEGEVYSLFYDYFTVEMLDYEDWLVCLWWQLQSWQLIGQLQKQTKTNPAQISTFFIPEIFVFPLSTVSVFYFMVTWQFWSRQPLNHVVASFLQIRSNAAWKQTHCTPTQGCSSACSLFSFRVWLGRLPHPTFINHALNWRELFKESVLELQSITGGALFVDLIISVRGETMENLSQPCVLASGRIQETPAQEKCPCHLKNLEWKLLEGECICDWILNKQEKVFFFKLWRWTKLWLKHWQVSFTLVRAQRGIRVKAIVCIPAELQSINSEMCRSFKWLTITDPILLLLSGAVWAGHCFSGPSFPVKPFFGIRSGAALLSTASLSVHRSEESPVLNKCWTM